MSAEVPKRWEAFLRDLDLIAKGETDFHCIGGFVVTSFYGFDRDTLDLDIMTVRSAYESEELFDRAQRGSALHYKHHVYLDRVSVVEAYPEDYESRLTQMFPSAFKNIRLWALEAHDLALQSCTEIVRKTATMLNILRG